MNQHFIYNILNQIQYFINRGEREASLSCMGRLSRLLRLWMDSPTGSAISATDEAALLEEYLGLESIRFPDRFTFAVDNTIISPHTVFLPSHIIFPLAAHAVQWMVKPEKGRSHIQVTLREDGPLIRCDISAVSEQAAAPFEAGIHLIPQHTKQYRSCKESLL